MATINTLFIGSRLMFNRKQIMSFSLILRISDVLTLRVAVPEEALPSDNSQERNTRNLMRELLETVIALICIDDYSTGNFKSTFFIGLSTDSVWLPAASH